MLFGGADRDRTETSLKRVAESESSALLSVSVLCQRLSRTGCWRGPSPPRFGGEGTGEYDRHHRKHDNDRVTKERMAFGLPT